MSNEFDIDQLLKPISESAPSGTWLRYDGTYDKIREARRKDDPSLPRGVWEQDLKRADWSLVVDLCTSALRDKTKDLQIAVWLCESWTEMTGLIGADASIRLLSGLCERFWDSIFPAAADDDSEARINLIDWVDGIIAVKLRMVPITVPSVAAPAYSLSDWNASLRLPNPESESPAVTHEAILARLSMSKYSTWLALQKQVDALFGLIAEFQRILSSKVTNVTAFHQLKGTLGGIKTMAEEGMKMTKPDAGLVSEPDLSPDVSNTGAGPAAVSGSPSRSGAGAITTRSEAYMRLNEAADFLLRTEPHSPVPYLVKRAIAWGNMSLGQLLYELMNSTEDLVAIQELLGMRKKGGEE